MPGRKCQVSPTSKYRYSINGQEKTDELNDNLTTALYWEYDSRIGKRWNPDPIIRSNESPYVCFYDNPLRYSDPNGNEPPKKPGFWTRLWRAATNDYYKTRAEDYASTHKIDEKNIFDLGKGTLVVVNDNNPNDIRYNIFRKSKVSNEIITFATSPKNDDMNLTSQQFANTKVLGNLVVDAPLPGGGSGAAGVMIAGSKSKSAIVGLVEKAGESLQAYKKIIRFGVNDKDMLVKGYHLHFDQIAPNLELALVSMTEGKIGLVQVGKLSIGTAKDIQRAVNLFNEAMGSSKFRAELLVRLKASQEFLQESFKFTKDAQQAIDKAHELNYLIKSVIKF